MNINEYRSFVIVIHDEFGCLLLKSSNVKQRKKKSFQLPGGRLDHLDLGGKSFNDKKVFELDNNVFKVGAARELFEETGLDYRNRLEKLELLNCNLPKKWRFFILNISSEDNLLLESNYNTFLGRLCCKTTRISNFLFGIGDLVRCLNHPNFCLRLSSEHNGFIFEKDLIKASQLLRYHSKGICSKALMIYIDNKHAENKIGKSE